MTDSFDRDYWQQHWASLGQADHDGHLAAPNPHLVEQTRDLTPGTALDAGCGSGTEAIWLARQGWQVVGADISGTALATAAQRGHEASVDGRVSWVEADLTTWEPKARFDLVTTHYAHPSTGQVALYRRISEWVAPGGTLLIVGHLHDAEPTGHGHHHPPEATATPEAITASLADDTWRIETAERRTRTVHTDGDATELRDVVVRLTRLR